MSFFSKEQIEKDIGEFVSCEECGVVLSRSGAKVVEHSSRWDDGNSFYCKSHAPKYDEKIILSGGIKYYRKIVDVDENGVCLEHKKSK